MELEAHDRRKAPGLSSKGLLHDIPDYGFGFRARPGVITGTELHGGCPGYYVEEEEERKEERRHCMFQVVEWSNLIMCMYI